MDSPLINIMIKAAKKASRGLRRDFNELENLQVMTKGPADFVTASDIRTQNIIYDELSYAKQIGLLLWKSQSQLTAKTLIQSL